MSMFFYICAGGTLTFYNALVKATGAAFPGSFIVTGYTFGSATVTSGPAYFYSQSVTCSNDYCGAAYVSGCTTPSSQTSSTTASIFVLQSGGQQTVDLCRGGGSSPTCCSGVTTSSCPPSSSANPCANPSYNSGTTAGCSLNYCPVCPGDSNNGYCWVPVNGNVNGPGVCAGGGFCYNCNSDADCTAGGYTGYVCVSVPNCECSADNYRACQSTCGFGSTRTISNNSTVTSPARPSPPK